MESKRLNPDREATQETNLLPVMNLMFLVIGCLLVSMEVAAMEAIPVEVPFAATGPHPQTKPDPEHVPLNLVVRIADEGYLIASSDQQEGAQAGQARDRSRPSIPVLPAFANAKPFAIERYDLARLRLLAEAYKKRYPAESRVSIAAHRDVPLDLVVATMDALRGRSCALRPQAQSRVESVNDCLFYDAVIVDN